MWVLSFYLLKPMTCVCITRIISLVFMLKHVVFYCETKINKSWNQVINGIRHFYLPSHNQKHWERMSVYT